MAVRRLGAALLLLPLLAAVEGERGWGRGAAASAPGRPLTRPRGRKVCPGAGAGRRWPREVWPAATAGEDAGPRGRPGERRALIDCARRRRRDHLAEAL